MRIHASRRALAPPPLPQHILFLFTLLNRHVCRPKDKMLCLALAAQNVKHLVSGTMGLHKYMITFNVIAEAHVAIRCEEKMWEILREISLVII